MSIRELEKRSDAQTQQIRGMADRLCVFLDQLAGPAPSKLGEQKDRGAATIAPNFLSGMNTSFNVRDAVIADLSEQIMRCEQLMGINQAQERVGQEYHPSRGTVGQEYRGTLNMDGSR